MDPIVSEFIEAIDGSWCSHLCGKYPSVLLEAVTYDADSKLFPIAFAFAKSSAVKVGRDFLQI